MTNLRLVAILALGSATANLSHAEPHGLPLKSVGTLETDRLWNSNDSNSGPSLTWEITHPSTLRDIVQYDSDTGTLVTETRLRVRLNVLGVGTRSSTAPHRAAIWSSMSSEACVWQPLFDGTPKTVRAREVLVDRIAPRSTTIPFAARGAARLDGSWYEFCTTLNPNGSIKCFTNGDPVPSAILNSTEPFLNAYLSDPADSTGQRSFTLGPKDILCCFELNASSTGDLRYDLQDLVILLSFEEV